jgi:O-antigen/teichoic acid export membrane protein
MKRIAIEGSWVIAGQVAVITASLALVRLLTENLEPDQYGVLGLALTLGTLTCQVAFSGTMPGVIRHYSIATEKNDINHYIQESNKVLSVSVVIAFLIGGIVLIVLNLVDKSLMLIPVGVAVMFSIVNSYNGTYNGVQNAARKRKLVALLTGSAAWLKVGFVVIFVEWFGGTPTLVITAYLMALMIIILIQKSYINKMLVGNVEDSKDSMRWKKDIWEYSRPFVLFNFFTWMQASSDRWALEMFSTTDEVGMYMVLLQLGYMPLVTVTGMAAMLISPILFSRSGDATNEKRNKGVHLISWKLASVSIALTILATFFTWLLHDMIFNMLVGNEYSEVSIYLPLMVFAGGMYATGQVFSIKLMSDLSTELMVWPKILTSIIGVLFSVLGAYIAGIKGVVIALVAYSIVHFVWLAIISAKSKQNSINKGVVV